MSKKKEAKHKKKLLLLTLALSLSLAQVMRAENDNEKKKHKRQAEAAAERGRQAAPPVGHAVQQPVQRNLAPVRERQRVKSEADLNRDGTQARNQTLNRNQHVNRGGNANFDRNSFSVARSRVVYGHHNRNWWIARYPHTRFVLFGGGFYFWNLGYWYPAYGYDPYYNNYAYSEPIYGYNNLAPGQVLENVQLALRHQGYYRGAIDGLIGPQTRGALAAYQRDHGLVITAAVDEPTLVTLGLA